MNEQQSGYRQVAVGQATPDAVTVGIEAGPDGQPKAAVWWEAKGDIDADEAEYANVPEAFAAAKAARALHGFSEIVVALQDGLSWLPGWGELRTNHRDKEPLGDVRGTDLSSNETEELAAGLETESDA